MFAWMLLALTVIPYEAAATDHVTAIELNHFYDDNGKHVFDQHIFYDWNPYANRFDVRDWKLIKAPGEAVYFDAPRGEFRTEWHDGLVMRSVRAGTYRETWTQQDPELVERAVLPKERRRELTSARKYKPIEDN